MTDNYKSKASQPCPKILRIPGFTPVEIPCDEQRGHKGPHSAEMRDEGGNQMIITWRKKLRG